MNRNRRTSRRSTLRSRYTLNGLFIPEHISNERIYEPTYRLTPHTPANLDHVQSIVEHSVQHFVTEYMPTYRPESVMQFIRNIGDDIRLRIEIQPYDRMRAVVIVNVTEKAHQGINWRIGTLFDPTLDRWTSFQYETKTYIVNVLAAIVYWD